MRTYTCHAENIKDLYRHIACCEVHYGVAIDQSKIIPPINPTVFEFTVDSGIQFGTKYKCPYKNKVCEKE